MATITGSSIASRGTTAKDTAKSTGKSIPKLGSKAAANLKPASPSDSRPAMGPSVARTTTAAAAKSGKAAAGSASRPRSAAAAKAVPDTVNEVAATTAHPKAAKHWCEPARETARRVAKHALPGALVGAVTGASKAAVPPLEEAAIAPAERR